MPLERSGDINYVVLSDPNGSLLYRSEISRRSQFRAEGESAMPIEVGKPIEVDQQIDPYNQILYALKDGPPNRISVAVFIAVLPEFRHLVSHMQRGEVLYLVVAGNIYSPLYIWMKCVNVDFATGGEAWAAYQKSLEGIDE